MRYGASRPGFSLRWLGRLVLARRFNNSSRASATERRLIFCRASTCSAGNLFAVRPQPFQFLPAGRRGSGWTISFCNSSLLIRLELLIDQIRSLLDASFRSPGNHRAGDRSRRRDLLGSREFTLLAGDGSACLRIGNPPHDLRCRGSGQPVRAQFELASARSSTRSPVRLPCRSAVRTDCRNCPRELRPRRRPTFPRTDPDDSVPFLRMVSEGGTKHCLSGIVNQPAKANAPFDDPVVEERVYREERARKGTNAVNGSSKHPWNSPPWMKRHGQDAKLRAQIDSKVRLRVGSTRSGLVGKRAACKQVEPSHRDLASGQRGLSLATRVPDQYGIWLQTQVRSRRRRSAAAAIASTALGKTDLTRDDTTDQRTVNCHPVSPGHRVRHTRISSWRSRIVQGCCRRRTLTNPRRPLANHVDERSFDSPSIVHNYIHSGTPRHGFSRRVTRGFQSRASALGFRAHVVEDVS